jgi:hypothetical protein
MLPNHPFSILFFIQIPLQALTEVYIRIDVNCLGW